MNLEECEFRDISHGANQPGMVALINKVVALNGTLEKEHCRIASFVNAKLNKLYYLAIWDGRVYHNHKGAKLFEDSSAGNLSLIGMLNIELQMGSMNERIPCKKGDVLNFEFAGAGYKYYQQPLLKHGILLPWKHAGDVVEEISREQAQ